MSKNKITNLNPTDEIKRYVSTSVSHFDSEYILRQADIELQKPRKSNEFGPTSNYYKALTLYELDKGILLSTSVPERFGVFALEFSKNLQAEFKCVTPSEKSLAELTALNFTRCLWLQDRMNSYIGIGTITDMGVRYLDMLSRELDRSERHYLTSLDSLRTLNSPRYEVNIRTNTAVVGQNQAVQVKNA